jgi:sulfate transport system substrate-binding protein
VAEAFVNFLYSEEAQRDFAKLGYRSVNPFVAQESAVQFPLVATLFNAQDLGGWSLIEKTFFVSGAIFDQIRGNAKA